jgi:uncharacterized sulfatase
MSAKKKKPNILFFFSDQQRWDTCGCYGQELPVTPNLDEMARQGVMFENSFTCQPVCGPARACLQGGKYATELGVFRNSIALPQNEHTVANAMKKAGYDTAYIGKWHLASTRTYPEREPDIVFSERSVPGDRRGGYDYWLAADALEHTSHSYDGHVWDNDGNKRSFPAGRYRVDVLTDWAMEYLDNQRENSDKPFFLFISFLEPHHQNDHECYEGPYGSKEKWRGYKAPGDLQGAGGDWRYNYPDYLGCCNALDNSLGRFRQKFKEMGIDDNTLIIYTSDHGTHFRTRNAEYKRSCHDGCTRIPLIINGPGFTGGKRVKELTSTVDVPRTVLQAADAQLLPGMRGNSLHDLAKGKVENWPDDVYIQISESGIGRAVRTHKWKYCVAAPKEINGNQPFSLIYHEAFLYDLATDPHETRNLIQDPALAAIRDEMRTRLLKHMREVNEPEAEIKPPKVW